MSTHDTGLIDSLGKMWPVDERAAAQARLRAAIDEAKLIARLLDLIDRASLPPEPPDDSVS